MKNKRNGKHEKRIKKLAVACTLCAVILTVSTYAWFIGMRTVNVSGFDVNIATTESLYLSLNGEDWDYTVNINEENIVDAGYDGNTNKWSDLIPMSSVGKINDDSSRLTMFEKGSFTASPGGYRIMASKVENSGPEEANGYVAFDLFIKNLSGNKYYSFLADPKQNEEAIYLTPESQVIVSDAGVDAEKTGIENSVRIAFAQIGRVIATTGADADAVDYDDQIDEITGISCAGGGNVTSICTRDATIWEPNDTKHVQNAINWYEEACSTRKASPDGDTIEDDASYNVGTPCGTIEDGEFYPTYAVSGVIDETDQVDTYDGAEYNGYTASVSPTAADGKLVGVDTFRDSEKNLKGTKRPEFMYLAPNSITKVRVYIYLEGQDVDNYDFASLGRQITINFGFTKERFDGEDIDYEGPELPEEVQSVRETSYTQIGTVGNILPATVTYQDGKFSVPRAVNEFTFTDNNKSYRAIYNTRTGQTEPYYSYYEIASYNASNDVTSITPTGTGTVTYDANAHEFRIPLTDGTHGVTGFTFNDGSQNMTASYQTNKWSFVEKP